VAVKLDVLGRVVSSRQTTEGLTAKAFTYWWGAGDVLTRVTYPSGRVVSYDYTGANRISAVRNGASYYAQGLTYKPHGALKGG
jgi:YD repeat-containing protein